MNLPDNFLPYTWLLGGHLVYAVVLGLALYFAPWRRLKDSDVQSVFFGSCVVLLLLWSLNAGIRPGLHVHFLGVTALTLMFGWQLAIIAVSLVVLGLSVNGSSGWGAFSLNVLLMGAVPILVTWLVHQAARRWLPAHFFVYVFINGFFGAALALAVAGTAGLAVMVASGLYTGEQVRGENLLLLPLLMFPEALLNGMALTLMVSYRPRWVSTFDDERYLRGK
jgi:uncharacterized membrane protein